MFHINFGKLDNLVESIIIIAIAIVVSRIASYLMHRYIKKSAQILKVDPTNYSFLQNAVSLVIFLFAVMFVMNKIPQFQTLGKTLFAGAGIIAAVVGFASQEAFSNIVSGVFLVIYKPFSVGDHIKLLSNQQVGVVEDITMRHTVLRGLENRRLVIPNSVISREAILNSTIFDKRIYMNIELLVTYQTNIEKALQVLENEIKKHPQYLKKEGEDIIEIESFSAKVVGLEPEGIRLRAYVWAQDNEIAFDMKYDLLKSLKERFEEEKIDLAYAQKTK